MQYSSLYLSILLVCTMLTTCQEPAPIPQENDRYAEQVYQSLEIIQALDYKQQENDQTKILSVITLPWMTRDWQIVSNNKCSKCRLEKDDTNTNIAYALYAEKDSISVRYDIWAKLILHGGRELTLETVADLKEPSDNLD